MNKLPLSYTYLLITLALASCNSKQQSASKAERDSLYSKLSDTEKRLPKNALAGIEVMDGLQAQLFASEPMIGNPTNIDVDTRGRVWMCEAYNYRSELNPENPTRKLGDRILILEDTDGDSKADTAKVFYQGTDINAALGVAVLGNKVIVSSSPNVFLFTDTNGDDVADKKEILYSGLGGEQHDHAIHSFTFGPDGKLYFNFGNEGKQILDKKGKPVIDKDGKTVTSKGNPYRQGMIFRVNPDGTEFEVLAHNFRNNYEAAVDSYGTLWQSDNDDDGNQGVRINYVMEFGNYGYTDEMTGAGWQSSRTNMETDIPSRHWHQNDPGSIPNLLQTGSGSPTGMVIYEGTLLPEKFQNQMIHCDPGHNVVRSYPVKNDGAGYNAEIVPIVEGRDQWFRPSDLCVAPDGSIFVADWYDPGVGGHQMGDMNRGRIFRIAPDAGAYRIEKPDLSSPEGAVKALQNPNLATRYLAWKKLHEWDVKAEPALKSLWGSDNQRFRARALWLLAKMKGKSKTYIAEALKDKNEDIRITGLRVARQTEKDIIPYIKQLVKDPSAQVRREAVIALHHNKSAEAPPLWAELALQYDGKDRWYLEALGIGADNQWDTYFTAWKEKAGKNLNNAAGRDITWRSRTGQALPLLANNITDDGTSSANRYKYFRAFDFINDLGKQQILLGMLDDKGNHKAEVIKIALNHIDPSNLSKSPQLKSALDQTLADIKGTREFVDLISRYRLRNHNQTLLDMALAQPDSSLGIEAAKLLISSGGSSLFKTAVNDKNGEVNASAFKVLSRVENDESMALLQTVVMDRSADPAVRKKAVSALGTGWNGEERLMKIVKAGKLPADMEAMAATTLAGAMRKDVRDDALKYLKVSNSADNKPLPPISQLVQQKGSVKAGQQVFMRTCVTCHQMGKQGVNFGPSLAQIGSKLTKDALYVSIIRPDAGISFGYEGYVIKMKDGTEAAGIISSETEDAIELKTAGGSKTKYAKSAISSRTKMENSMMPANLQQTMTGKEIVDLVEYLYSLKSPSGEKMAKKF